MPVKFEGNFDTIVPAAGTDKQNGEEGRHWPSTTRCRRQASLEQRGGFGVVARQQEGLHGRSPWAARGEGASLPARFITPLTDGGSSPGGGR